MMNRVRMIGKQSVKNKSDLREKLKSELASL
jgi:hypothetical protein